MRLVNVQLDDRSYPIHIGGGLLRDRSLLAHAIRGRHVLVVSNETIAPLFLQRALDALRGFDVHTLILPDGEQFKTLEQCARIFDALAAMQASRDATLVALGGGVIGDMVGFAAACWMRGVPFVQVPTTLLAMVDSSVGGKTAVNLPAGKNLVGAFHQPSAVLIDLYCLDTLPEREYRAGLAEVVKYAAIRDAAFMAWLESHTDALLAREQSVVGEAVERSCAHKAGIVARDESEQGERALLNFGHTFGHALEAHTRYREWLHGEAIAIGMCQAAALSTRLGMAPAADALRLRNLLARLGLPVTATDAPPDALLALMRLDKKVLSGTLRLILWRGVGDAEIVAGVEDSDILAVLEAQDHALLTA